MSAFNGNGPSMRSDHEGDHSSPDMYWCKALACYKRVCIRRLSRPNFHWSLSLDPAFKGGQDSVKPLTPGARDLGLVPRRMGRPRVVVHVCLQWQRTFDEERSRRRSLIAGHVLVQSACMLQARLHQATEPPQFPLEPFAGSCF
ncbi:hypothetical protein L2E82_48899 [Cichorium intybus]|uniref:Uncharacterized protein n=1 Tax=Cichorium intybus TaxID=13427 RepID=A0ACB8YYZ0_CICIN|nr:hypothetical protein L2E82_48899 [Cichorium intybus]